MFVSIILYEMLDSIIVASSGFKQEAVLDAKKFIFVFILAYYIHDACVCVRIIISTEIIKNMFTFTVSEANFFAIKPCGKLGCSLPCLLVIRRNFPIP